VNVNGRDLAEDVAILTGAGVNTGSTIAKTLARAGARVVVNYRNAESGARETVREIEKSGGEAIAVRGDVCSPEDVRSLVAVTVETFGPPTILVNNANVRSFRPVLEITLEEWRQTLGPTLDGTFFAVQACVPHMRAAGRGTIVNIGGGSGHSGRPHRCHVAAAKAGLAGMTGALAAELAPDNITVNCIVPGKIETRDAAEIAQDPNTAASPMRRPCTQQEIADLVHFLCGRGCRFMSGQMLHVNGAKYVTIA
jgi:3-oxoacyl-[acyl-carrier protein] reductase